MSKIDQKYIDALDIFTESLDMIVETLKEQQKSNSVDVVNDFLKQPMDNLVLVVGELKEITQKGFAEVKAGNTEILKKIESIKNQKESGMFDRIEDPKNKNKIVDGIKVVILIAAGVLALGSAFKIIGKVDLLSVIALSSSIYIMSITFSKMVDLKNLKYADIVKISSILPIMSLGIFLSGLILSGIPEISLNQGLSILFIGSSLGIATYLLMKSVGSITPKSLFIAPIIPFLLPLIALGIVKSSEILQNIKSISLNTAIDIALVGISMGIATLAIGIILKNVKDVSWDKMVSLPVMLPLIAMGIVYASTQLVDFNPIKDPLKMLIGVATIGLSLLLFVPTIILLSKLKSSDIVKGTLAVLAVSGVILLTSIIFSALPSELKYPPIDWSIGIGLSLLIFGVNVRLMGVMSLLPTFWIGFPALLAVVGSMVAISYLIQSGVYNGNYPSIEWATGVGSSLLLFSLAMVAASVGGVASLIGTLFNGGEDPLLRVTRSMVDISKYIQDGNYSGNYPKQEWALGVGTAILLFASATVVSAAIGLATSILSFFSGDSDPLMTVAKSMVNVSKEIQNGIYTGNFPKNEWALGVGTAILLFASATVVSAATGLANSILSFFSGDVDPLMTVAKSMVNVSKEIQNDVYDNNYPKQTWSQAVGVALLEFIALTVAASAQGLISSISNLLSGNNDPLLTIAKSITSISRELQTGIYNGNVPNIEWSTNTSKLLIMFSAIVKDWDIRVNQSERFKDTVSNIISAIVMTSKVNPIPNNLSDGYVLFFNGLNNIPKLTASDSRIMAVKTLTDRFYEMANTLGKVNTNLETFISNYNKLDLKKIDQLTTTVDKSASALGITKPDDKQNSVSKIIGNIFDSKNSQTEYGGSLQSKNNTTPQQEQFYKDISDIKVLLIEFKENINKPTSSGSFHK